MIGRAAIAISLAAGAVTMSAAVAFAPEPFRACVVLPLALLLPGTAIASTIFPKGSGLGKSVDVGVAIVLSLVFYPVVALILHAFAVRLSPTSVTAAVDFAVAGGYLAAAMGSLVAEPAERSLLEARAVAVRRDAAAAAFVAAVAGAAVITLAAARAALPAPPAAPYAAFAVTGRWAHIHGVAYIHGHKRLRIGLQITNATAAAVPYRIRAASPGGRWSQPAVTVDAGGTWRGVVTGRVRRHPCDQRVVLVLRSSERRLRLSIQLRIVGADCRGPARAPRPRPAPSARGGRR